MKYETIYCSPQETKKKTVRKMTTEGKFIRRLSDQWVIFTVGSHYCIGGFAYHRLGGPALIDRTSNVIRFFIIDQEHFVTDEYCRDAGMSGEETLMWVLRFGNRLPKTCDGFYGYDWQSIPLDQL